MTEYITFTLKHMLNVTLTRYVAVILPNTCVVPATQSVSELLCIPLFLVLLSQLVRQKKFALKPLTSKKYIFTKTRDRPLGLLDIEPKYHHETSASSFFIVSDLSVSHIGQLCWSGVAAFLVAYRCHPVFDTSNRQALPSSANGQLFVPHAATSTRQSHALSIIISFHTWNGRTPVDQQHQPGWKIGGSHIENYGMTSCQSF